MCDRCACRVRARTVASRALGDVVKKLGERVLPEMVPFLRRGLDPSNSTDMRQGVCLGLAEVLHCASKRQIEDYLEELMETVQEALCDAEACVREHAAEAFGTLHRAVGSDAVDIVPSLLAQLKQDDRRERALFGLCQVNPPLMHSPSSLLRPSAARPLAMTPSSLLS